MNYKFTAKRLGQHWYLDVNHNSPLDISFNSKIEKYFFLFNCSEIEIKLYEVFSIVEENTIYLNEFDVNRYFTTSDDFDIRFTVRDHEFFERDEDDIYIELPLTITEATLGCKKEVPTLYGNVTLTIPSGTSTDDKLRLKGKGVENVSSKRKGDMYVIAKVIIPEKLNREQKKLFEQLAETALDNSPEFRKYYKFLNK